MPTAGIARALNLSVETIKDHVAAVLRRLKVSSRTQAVLVVGEMSNHGAEWRLGSGSAALRPDGFTSAVLTRPS
jgi:Bacterial regulatory proteins, luxR family